MQRPLSPHLQIYRPQLTSVLSIMHRLAGMVLVISALFLTWWLWSVASGRDDYRIAYEFFNSWFGKPLLFIWTLCTFYHLCNGIRHLFWDAGYGFDLSTAYWSGRIVVVVAFGATLYLWLM